ncbi:hypothetical protein DSL72_006041 [Monilinia vaccinii-corymbosi]|uniref:Zn(2)-C6 fungal-type domain-containing protein n=1 Tax=Monilinia vaccinii-corymbosi TaxID=61207 RepID=A0A8A3PHD8_9HELO|nr:hypothetical protein DSL72_006041 [Monilinia vaccinii-corymbosi]
MASGAGGRGSHRSDAPTNNDDPLNFMRNLPGFIPWGGWQDDHPAWMLGGEATWDRDQEEDIFGVGGVSNRLPQGTPQYTSPYVNIADGKRVIEPEVNPWDVMGGIAGLAPVVRSVEAPPREVRWLGPQPGQIPLGQQFESEVMEWEGLGPPSFQHQRGREAPMVQYAGGWGERADEVLDRDVRDVHGRSQYGRPPEPLGHQPERGDFSQFPNLEAIDEGPRRTGESITAWRARVVTSRKAIGVVDSELRRRPYSFPTTAQQANDTPEQFKARLNARRKVKAQWEKDKEVHKNKMDHTHKSFDPEYAARYRAEKAARQFENAKRRKTALLIARRIAERDNQPRPVTPELPEDSSDEDLPAMPPRDRGAFAGGPGPKPKRCLHCKHMRKPCTLVSGSPRPCDRCKSRGIVCEITRDLQDPKAAPPGGKQRNEARNMDEEEDEDEDEEPITAQEKASLLRKKRATFNQRAKRRNPQRQMARRRSASPEAEASSNTQCKPCRGQARPCDGENICGTCRLNGTEDMCTPVYCFSRRRERDYREEGESLQREDNEEEWATLLAGVQDNKIDVEWDNLVSRPEEAEEAIRNMDLGLMMNYSSAVIQDSIETARQNLFLQSNFDQDLLAMRPFEPVPGGPSFNRLSTVVEPNASYNSIAPRGPDITAEPFGDVAYYTGMTFGGDGIDHQNPYIASENTVERPDSPDGGLDGVLDEVERHRSGIEVITLRGDPDPDAALQGKPLSNYRREWKQDWKGILKSKHCDELIGIDICFKNRAKHCDCLQHGIEGGDWHTCVSCHKDQNVRVADAQENIIEYTKLYYCKECVAEQRPRTRRGRISPGFRKEYCTCTSQIRKSWLCNAHRDEAISDVMERSIAVKNWMVRRDLYKCNGCDTRALGEKTAMWACSSCREVVYV